MWYSFFSQSVRRSLGQNEDSSSPPPLKKIVLQKKKKKKTIAIFTPLPRMRTCKVVDGGASLYPSNSCLHPGAAPGCLLRGGGGGGVSLLTPTLKKIFKQNHNGVGVLSWPWPLRCLGCRFTRNHCACAPILYISELCEDCTVANEIDYETDCAWTSIHDNGHVVTACDVWLQQRILCPDFIEFSLFTLIEQSIVKNN